MTAARTSRAAPGRAPTQSRSGFGYVPGLDGVRAIAALGVMGYHGGLSFMPGGLFELDTFFCLSGFLITSLLLGEWASTGTIALRAFWARRARRLLPAVVLVVLAVTAYARFVAPPGTYPGLRLDSLATLFYVANWHFILVGQNYFVQTGPPSPLLHTWSLSVEEQFYLVWPLVILLVLRGRRASPERLGVVAGLGAVVSGVEMALLYHPGIDPTRVYFGTDTHAQSLMVGATLAVTLFCWRERRTRAGRSLRLSRQARTGVVAAGLVGTAVLVLLSTQLTFSSSFTFQGGTFLSAVAVAGMIASLALVPEGALGKVFSTRVLRYLGSISYGMYLWHFPVDIWLTAARTGLTGYPLFLLRTGVAIGLADLSFRFIEVPIRRGTLFVSIRAWLVAPATLGLAGVLLLAGTATAASGASLDESPGFDAHGSASAIPVLIEGDSVGETLGFGLSEVQANYDLNIEDKANLGCGIAMGQEVSELGVQRPLGTPCLTTSPVDQQWPAQWAQQIASFHPQVVVVVAGRWETVDRQQDGNWSSILDPAVAATVRSALEEAVTVGSAQGARVVLETSPCFDEGEQPDGSPWPEDDPARVTAYNQLVDQVAAEHPGVAVAQDLFSMACPGGRFTMSIDGITVRTPDGIHFTNNAGANGGTVLAPELLPLWERLGKEPPPTPTSTTTTLPGGAPSGG